jgi:hypothetical protein
MLSSDAIGFTGAYRTDPAILATLFQENSKNGTASLNVTSGVSTRRRLLAVNATSFSGITNPSVCLTYGEIMMWTVDNTNYPIYDTNNLYNTNSEFDYGGFRALIEALMQSSSSSTLFVYKFTEAGTYVFYLSSNINKKMVSIIFEYLGMVAMLYLKGSNWTYCHNQDNV